MFETALSCLALKGRLVEISATGGRMVSFDLADFYHNENRLLGADSFKRDLIQSARMLGALRPHFESGVFRAAPSPRASASPKLPKPIGTWPPERVVLTPQSQERP